jgi:antitoxin MazE
MQTSVVKWGNSHGIRLPKAFLKSINIVENDHVDVTLDKNKIIIKKLETKKRKKLEQRLFEFYGENFEMVVEPQKEYNWGKSVGKEVW